MKLSGQLYAPNGLEAVEKRKVCSFPGELKPDSSVV
jgi:hypothetical protein